MKSAIASAVLSAAALVNAASIPHGHAHTHTRRAAVEKREPLQFMSASDVSRLASVVGFGGATAKPTDNLVSQPIKTGLNLAAALNPKAPVTVGGDGPFLVEFKNESPDDIVVVVWSNLNKANPWDAAIVTQNAADITHTLRANTTTTVSFNPEVAPLNKISGGWAAVYPDTIMNNGFIFEPWGEYTFTKMSVFSTTDVSRVTNMKGHKTEIHNYANKGDAKPACSSTMNKCSFVCPDPDADFCKDNAYIQNCPVGTPGTTSSSDYAHGGCAGMRDDGGFMKVSFF
ncbi:hypothetical protein CAC42_2463 [Sphaceloma murrayae]|uniref:Uncharacterized protein n=1 Tax=Sphaceloma murrayae TaxID=2082308 RepID=A0A2K1QW56_9PEZI|nr:hypothetical protein CAC42_2463 [Sphaceloma murrayae]